jgi:hypothetical protein
LNAFDLRLTAYYCELHTALEAALPEKNEARGADVRKLAAQAHSSLIGSREGSLGDRSTATLEDDRLLLEALEECLPRIVPTLNQKDCEDLQERFRKKRAKFEDKADQDRIDRIVTKLAWVAPI